MSGRKMSKNHTKPGSSQTENCIQTLEPDSATNEEDFQKCGLEERLSPQQMIEGSLRSKIQQLEKKQSQNDDRLTVINRNWNKFNEDIRLMLNRCDPQAADGFETLNERRSGTSSFIQLTTGNCTELDEKLVNFVQVSRRAFAKIIQGFHQRNDEIEELKTELQEERRLSAKRLDELERKNTEFKNTVKKFEWLQMAMPTLLNPTNPGKELNQKRKLDRSEDANVSVEEEETSILPEPSNLERSPTPESMSNEEFALNIVTTHMEDVDESPTSSLRPLTLESDANHGANSQTKAIEPKFNSQNTIPVVKRGRKRLKTTQENPYKCVHCSKSYVSESAFQAHILSHGGASERDVSKSPKHPGAKPFVCSYCGKSFSKNSLLRTHERLHTGEKPYECSYCSRSFRERGSLLSHIRTHTGEKPFSCSLCPKSFAQNSTLQVHLRLHTGERPYSCHHCPKTFISNSTLRRHLHEISGERPYACSYCDKTFIFFSRYHKHLKMVHWGKKIKFSCPVCSESFPDKSSLKKHAQEHHTDLNK